MIPRDVKKNIADDCIAHTKDEYPSSNAKQFPGPCDSWFGRTQLGKFCHDCAHDYEGDLESQREIEELCIVILDIPSICLEELSDNEDAAFSCSACAHYNTDGHEGLEDAAEECLEEFYSNAKTRH